MLDVASPRLTSVSAGLSMASRPKPPSVLHNKKTYLAACEAASQQQPGQLLKQTILKSMAPLSGRFLSSNLKLHRLP